MSEYLVDRLAAHGDDFDSSNIDLLGYDRESETLYVEFHGSGTVYSYAGVKESTFDMLVNADSVGSFYARHIKGTYTGDIEGEGFITLREDDEVDPIQPDQKWLSVPPGGTPYFARGSLVQGAYPHFVMSTDSIFTSGSTNVPVVTPSRYVVQWTSDDFNGAGPFKPEFQAMSEADALAQFNAQVVATFGSDLNVKIQAVTHYFG